MEDILYLLTDHTEKKKFDKFLKDQRTIKEIDSQTILMHSHIKMPFMITDREFLQERTILRDYKDFDVVIILRSVESEDYLH